jgi:hypothetical protein
MEDRGHITAEIKADPRYVKFRRICVQAEGNLCTSESQLNIFEAALALPGCTDATCRSENLTEDELFRIDIALLLSGGQKLAMDHIIFSLMGRPSMAAQSFVTVCWRTGGGRSSAFQLKHCSD